MSLTPTERQTMDLLTILPAIAFPLLGLAAVVLILWGWLSSSESSTSLLIGGASLLLLVVVFGLVVLPALTSPA